MNNARRITFPGHLVALCLAVALLSAGCAGGEEDDGVTPSVADTPSDTGTPPSDTGTPPSDTGTPPSDTGTLRPTGPEDVDGDGHEADVDCDDTNADVYPGAAEVCDGIDNDCDRVVDGEDAIGTVVNYPDGDGDGFGDGDSAVFACERLADHVEVDGDCDDTNELVHPARHEICDGLDNDCDVTTSESGTVWLDGMSFGSVQAAIDSAPSSGAVVELCDGTYFENLYVGDSFDDLTIRSVHGPEVTILDGGGTDPVLATYLVESVELEGLTFQNGSASYSGGGVDLFIVDRVTIRDCHFLDNESGGSGGGLEVDPFVTGDGVTLIENSVFIGNSAASDGGGMAMVGDSLRLVDNTFEDNHAAEGSGGGLYFWSDTIEIEQTDFLNNTAGLWGGGIYALGGEITLLGGTISGNDGDLGGGLYTHYSEILQATDTIIASNLAVDGAGLVAHSPVDLTNVTLVDNVAAGTGGAVYMLDDLRMTDSVVHRNSALQGGGVFADQTTTYTVFTSVGTDWGTGADDNLPEDFGMPAAGQSMAIEVDISCDVSTGQCEEI